MSSLIKSKSGQFYLQFYRDDRRPKRRQVPLKTSSKRTATRVRSHVDELYLRGEFDPWETTDFVKATSDEGGVTRLSDAVSAFLRSREGRSARTIGSYKQVLDGLGRTLPDGVAVHEVTRDDVLRWLRSGKAGATTQHTMARHASVFFRWARDEGEVTDPTGRPVRNPTVKLRLPTAPKKRPRLIRPGEVATILDALPTSGQGVHSGRHWLYPVVRSNVILGLRAGEVCRLSWGDVDFGRGELVVYTTKGHSDRAVPLSAVVVEELDRARSWAVKGTGREPEPGDRVFRTSPEAVPMCSRYLSRQFKKYVRLALPSHRADEINFHSTRHSAASYLAQAGKTAEFVREYMGHASVATTYRYVHLDRRRVHDEAIGIFDGLFSGD